jgi:hypothetical protein
VERVHGGLLINQCQCQGERERGGGGGGVIPLGDKSCDHKSRHNSLCLWDFPPNICGQQSSQEEEDRQGEGRQEFVNDWRGGVGGGGAETDLERK